MQGIADRAAEALALVNASIRVIRDMNVVAGQHDDSGLMLGDDADAIHDLEAAARHLRSLERIALARLESLKVDL